MAKFNDIDMSDWKQSDIITDSLWVIPQRDNSGKHSNFYHGNFIPQIPNQFIRRYTKKGDTILDPFIGSGTTAIECENLNRNCIGIDIRDDLIHRLKDMVSPDKGLAEFLEGNRGKIGQGGIWRYRALKNHYFAMTLKFRKAS